MFPRAIESKLLQYKDKYRAIALVGPRQSGKTTLARSCFPDYDYLSLENPDIRARAIEDPKGLLSSIAGNVILDEIQQTPDILSYLQEILDDKQDLRSFILTGSNSLQLNQRISQSLAGRVRILRILPFYRQELPKSEQNTDLNTTLFFGGYPRIYDEKLEPNEWFADYYNTYVQKDVRSLIQIENLSQFDRFIRVTAGHAGHLSNHASIASDVGVQQPTITRWISVLEASFLLFRLEPHFRNFSKRIIKSSKYYFYDTGLLCYLLRISSPEQLDTHPLRGAIFENWVAAEAHKMLYSSGREPALYFWRDQHGHEVDLVTDFSTHLFPTEIKSGATFQATWLKNIDWFNKLQHFSESCVVYGGRESFSFKDTRIVSWLDFPGGMEKELS